VREADDGVEAGRRDVDLTGALGLELGPDGLVVLGVAALVELTEVGLQGVRRGVRVEAEDTGARAERAEVDRGGHVVAAGRGDLKLCARARRQRGRQQKEGARDKALEGHFLCWSSTAWGDFVCLSVRAR
jgi:hypothetical protein